jgi:hypothetical protein
MFGCYRKGDANDPETYVAAITATLARYPEDVILRITHPVDGLPGQKDFLPTVAEVRRACESEMGPRRRRLALERQREQERAEEAAREKNRNTPEEDAKVLAGLRKLAASLESGIWDDEATGEKLPPQSDEEENAA